jgi:hypothetical protein
MLLLQISKFWSRMYSPVCCVCGEEGLIKHLKYKKCKVFPITYDEGMWEREA